MLTEDTFRKLNHMKMYGLAKALEEQFADSQYRDLTFDERVGLLIDREWSDRESRRLTRRLQAAKLREQACLEDIDYRTKRGLDRKLIARLATCQWVTEHDNVIICGPTGIGKTYLACALAQQACRKGGTALYRRVPRLFHELVLARADGSLPRLFARFAKADLLVLDDWGIAPLAEQERRDLLEILDDRSGTRSTIVASQVPTVHWHKVIAEPTIADAIIDRLVHNAHRIDLKGDSMRKRHSTNLTKEGASRN